MAIGDQETSEKQPAPAGPLPAPMLNVEDIAGILKCSARTVHRLADAGKMPAPCRLGAMVRWSATAIDAWIASGCPECRRLGRR
ncbi:MAG: helix-turn-helix domain-containing protein [Planctomycetota bacterium]|nr:helix-turn-helix domain-containing protein [Planctomycetota bacterium]